MTLLSIPISGSQVPIQLTFDLGGTTPYIFQFYCNARADFYTLYIFDLDLNLLYTTKLVYGGAAIHAVIDALTYQFNLIPFSELEAIGGTYIPQALNQATFGIDAEVYIANSR